MQSIDAINLLEHVSWPDFLSCSLSHSMEDQSILCDYGDASVVRRNANSQRLREWSLVFKTI